LVRKAGAFLLGLACSLKPAQSSLCTGNNHRVMLAMYLSGNPRIFHGRTTGTLIVFPFSVSL
jgi:hypothetical protein